KQTLPLTPAKDEIGSGTVSVVAKLADGKELKTSFKVSVAAVPVKQEPQRDEISAYIFLVNTTTRSDGTGSAVIRDRFNPQDYEIEVTPQGVKVSKFSYRGGVERRTPVTSPLLVITDDDIPGEFGTSTKRTFK